MNNKRFLAMKGGVARSRKNRGSVPSDEAGIERYLRWILSRSLRHVRTKAALKRLGIIASDMVREPLLPLEDAERRKLEKAMLSAGLIEPASVLASAA